MKLGMIVMATLMMALVVIHTDVHHSVTCGGMTWGNKATPLHTSTTHAFDAIEDMWDTPPLPPVTWTARPGGD